MAEFFGIGTIDLDKAKPDFARRKEDHLRKGLATVIQKRCVLVPYCQETAGLVYPQRSYSIDRTISLLVHYGILQFHCFLPKFDGWERASRPGRTVAFLRLVQLVP